MKRIALLALSFSVLACAPAEDPLLAPDPPCTALPFERPEEPPNIVLIVADTTRRDRVGLYGGQARTPHFDAFAGSGFYFDWAYAPAPWTLPSVASMLTSLHPSQHGLSSHVQLREKLKRESGGAPLPEVDVLSEEHTTLVEVLQQAGYQTSAIVSNPWLLRGSGLEQGYDWYDGELADWEMDGAEVSRRGLDWLAGREAEQPFFLYLHYMDSHLPYGPLDEADIEEHFEALKHDQRRMPSMDLYSWLVDHEHHDLSGETREKLKKLGPRIALLELTYDRGVEKFDEALGLFLEGFDALPAADNTVVIVLSDHGEALSRRRYTTHGIGLYDDETAIPFAARFPGVTVEEPRVDRPVGLIDLMPTLCDYLALDCPQTMFGRSFLGGEEPAEGGRPDAYIVAEGAMLKPNNRMLRNRNYKLISEPDGPAGGGAHTYVMFDLRKDAGEEHDLAQVEEERRRLMAKIAEQAVPEFEGPALDAVALDDETFERLQNLGYLN